MTEILIRKTEETDIEKIVSIENDIENSRFIFPNTREEHIRLIKDENVEHLVLTSENNKFVGFIILAGIKDENRNIEFRRIVLKEKGKGLGRIAIKKMKQFCFEKLKCHRLWLDVLEMNKRALHLYQSEDFKVEGTLRDCVLIDNNYKNLIILSILENEYTKNTVSTR